MTTVDTLVTIATGLNATAQDLLRAATRLHTTAVTVSALLPEVQAACPKAALSTYNAQFVRIATRFHDHPVGAITTQQLTQHRREVRLQVAQARLDAARRQKRPLLAADVDGLGHGAAATYTNAARFFFKQAQMAGHRSDNPASSMKQLAAPPGPERPLDSHELAELLHVAGTTGDDPELDILLLKTGRILAARREGLINMRLCDLDRRRRSIWLNEKYGKTREMPAPRWLIDELREHASRRGATDPADSALRYSSGRPLTESRFSTLFDRLDTHTDWSARLDVGIHWIRHTTLSDIETIAGLRVAAAYAGHSDESVGITGRYAKVTLSRLSDAQEALFGAR